MADELRMPSYCDDCHNIYEYQNCFWITHDITDFDSNEISQKQLERRIQDECDEAMKFAIEMHRGQWGYAL